MAYIPIGIIALSGLGLLAYASVGSTPRELRTRRHQDEHGSARSKRPF